MGLTMLEALKKGKKKKPKPQNKQYTGQVSAKYINATDHSMAIAAIYALEFFMTVHDTLDWLEDHCPQDFTAIAELVEQFSDMEKKWHKEKFESNFPQQSDRNQLFTFVSRHYYDQRLVDYREMLRRSVSMRAVRNHYPKPYLIGTILMLEIAMEFLNMSKEKEVRKLRCEYKLNGMGKIADEAAQAVYDSICIDDHGTIVCQMVGVFAQLLGMKSSTVEEYCTNRHIADKIYYYSVLFYKVYSKQSLTDVYELCQREANEKHQNLSDATSNGK